MGESSSVMVVSSVDDCMPDLLGRRTSERPDSLRSRTLGKVIPPGGPKVDDLRPESMCGDEVECLRARRCSMGGIPGEGGTSKVVLLTKSVVLVLRLN